MFPLAGAVRLSDAESYKNVRCGVAVSTGSEFNNISMPKVVIGLDFLMTKRLFTKSTCYVSFDVAVSRSNGSWQFAVPRYDYLCTVTKELVETLNDVSIEELDEFRKVLFEHAARHICDSDGEISAP